MIEPPIALDTTEKKKENARGDKTNHKERKTQREKEREREKWIRTIL